MPPRALSFDREALMRALRRRRNQILLAVATALVAVRIALPYVLRPLIVSQADQALVGRIALEGLDLSLLRGGVTLRGLALYNDELPKPGETAKPALFETKRLWVNVSWLALLWKTLEVEQFELEDFELRLDRLKDGLALPRPAPSDTPAPPEPAPQASQPSKWAFAADGVRLRAGEVTFRDFTVGDEPQRFDLAIGDVEARGIALRFDPSGAEPGHLALQALIGGGSIAIDAQLEQREAGPAVLGKYKLENLPIGGVRVYLKTFGWSDLAGVLSADIAHRYETGGAHEIGGRASLDAVLIRVPGLDRPALAFDRLAVVLDKIDIVKRHAAVSEVTLTGAHLPVDPMGKQPLPVLTPPNAPVAAGPPAAEEPASTGEAGKPWSWSLSRAALDSASVDLLGGAEPLSLIVDAEAKSLSSVPNDKAKVSLRVREGAGSLALSGSLGLTPLAFDGKLGLSDLALAPLAQRAAPQGKALRAGRARADLSLALAPAASGAAGGTNLTASGTLGVAGLDLGESGQPEFSTAWKDLGIALKSLSVAPLFGGDPAAPRAVDVAFDRIELNAPNVRVTRTADGIVLPASLASPPAQAAAPAAPPAAEPKAPPALALKAQITKARLYNARLRLTDRSVTPHYEGRIEQLEVRARGVRYPGPFVDSFAVVAQGLQGAKLEVHGGILPTGSVLKVKLETLPLAPFNPYVSSSGFEIRDGALTLSSKAKLEGESYDSKTDLSVARLGVGGAQGESIFQENFGIPLSVAVGLLKDLNGDIKFNIPVAGDRQSGANLGLMSLAGQALRKALVNALASPLKLLGVVMGEDGKVTGGMAPEPVDFAAGGAEPDEAGVARLEQLTALLQASPSLVLTLHGGTAESDERVLRERALLAELDRTSGVRALGQLGEIGVRRAVRSYLKDEAAGKTPEPLDPDQSAWLEAKLAAESLDPAALESLADARASALANLLVTSRGLPAERVVIGAPAAAGSLARPGVALAIGTLQATVD